MYVFICICLFCWVLERDKEDISISFTIIIAMSFHYYIIQTDAEMEAVHWYYRISKTVQTKLHYV